MDQLEEILWGGLVWFIRLDQLNLLTLGPAGPPLHKGVFEVPQSAQVFLFCSFTWLSSDETPPEFFPDMSSDSDPCTINNADQKPGEKSQNQKRIERNRGCLLTLSLGSSIIRPLMERSERNPDLKNPKLQVGSEENDRKITESNVGVPIRGRGTGSEREGRHPEAGEEGMKPRKQK